MAKSPNLGAPLLTQGQAQKELTVNEGVVLLDGFVNNCLHELNASTPPQSPVLGGLYYTSSTPSGEWANYGGYLALYTESGWRYILPQEGCILWSKPSLKIVVFDGTQWVAQ